MDEPADAYGTAWAPVYDHCYEHEETEAAVSLLASLAAPSGPALELGVGTGRLAIPLASRGIETHGLDASGAMLNRLRQKPGGDRVRTWIGDFGQDALGTGYRLVFSALSTFFQLPDHRVQRACLVSARTALAPTGRLVLEAFVPRPALFSASGQPVELGVWNNSKIETVTEHDRHKQLLSVTYRVSNGKQVEHYPLRFCYFDLQGLDNAATAAGLQLVQRLGSWSGRPFTAGSDRHVSIYRPA